MFLELFEETIDCFCRMKGMPQHPLRGVIVIGEYSTLDASARSTFSDLPDKRTPLTHTYIYIYFLSLSRYYSKENDTSLK